MIRDVLKSCLNNYKHDMLTSLGFSDFNEESEEILNEKIEDDLSDKGFTDAEIQDIQNQSITKETAYKFVAYFILLINDYDDVKSLQAIIEDSTYFDAADLTQTDLDTILKYRVKLDY